MTDLQLLQAMLHGNLPRASISETIPMTMNVTEADIIHFGIQTDKRHLNPLGGAHDGFAATVLDSATGYAVYSMLEAGVGYGMVDLNVKMVKTVPVDTSLVAVGCVLYLLCTIGMSGDTLKTQDGTLFVHAMAMRTIRRP